MALPDFPALLDRVFSVGGGSDQSVGAEDRSALEALAEASPGYVTAHVALAQVWEAEGRPAEARRCWQRARLLLPESPAVRDGLRRTAATETDADAAEPPPAEGASTAGQPAAGKGAAEQGAAEQDARRRPAGPPGEWADEEMMLQHSDGDLDSLIEELEHARIKPTPDTDDVPAPDLDAGEGDVVSPTLARIYEAQGQYAEAARVYRRLAEQRPAQAEAFREQAEALQARADEAGSSQSRSAEMPPGEQP